MSDEAVQKHSTDFIVRSFCNYHSGTVGSRVHAVDSCDVDLRLWPMRMLKCEEALLSHMSGWIPVFLCFSASQLAALLLVHAFSGISRLEHTSFLLGLSFACVTPLLVAVAGEPVSEPATRSRSVHLRAVSHIGVSNTGRSVCDYEH